MMKKSKLRVISVLIISLFGLFINSQNVSAEDVIDDLRVLDYNVLNDYSDTIEFTSDKFAIIKGDLVDKLLVNDVIAQIKVNELIADYGIIEVKLVKDDVSLEESEEILGNEDVSLGENEEMLGNDDVVLNGMRLVFDDSNVYNIIVVGDIYSDGIVDSLDANKMIEDYFGDDVLVGPLNDINNDGYFNNLDVTFIMNAIDTKCWENIIAPYDNLIGNLVVNKSDIYVNDEFEVSYLINGFELDFINGIEGNLVYNKDYLQYMDYSINKFRGIIDEDGKFKFILDNSNETDDEYVDENGEDKRFVLTIRFKAIKEGNTSVSVNDIIASMNGKLLNLDSNSVSNDIVINSYGTGGDIEIEPDNSEDTSQEEVLNNSKNEVTNLVVRPVVSNNIVTNKVEEKNTDTVVATVISLSNDSYIKSLEIKDYDLDFDKEKYEYSISVPYEVDSLDLNIVLNDEKASYNILGNNNFEVGKNVVQIVVTAEDGSEKTYTINVNREKEEVLEEEEEVSNSSRVVIIILIILVIIGLIYVIFKDDEEDEN